MSIIRLALSVKDYVDGVENKDFVIGIHQRDYKWNKEKVEDLFRSIYEGWIIPEIIGYKPIPPDDKADIEDIKKIYVRKELPRSIRNIKDNIYILDGGQRTRSLYIGMYGSFTMGSCKNASLHFNVSQKNSSNKIFALYKNDDSNVKRANRDIYIKVKHLIENDDISELSIYNELDIECMKNIERLIDSLVKQKDVINIRYTNYTNDVATTLFERINTNVEKASQSMPAEALLKKHYKNVYDIVQNVIKIDNTTTTGREWMSLRTLLASYYINKYSDVNETTKPYKMIVNDPTVLNEFKEDYEEHLKHLETVDNHIRNVVLKDDFDLKSIYENKSRTILFIFLQLYYKVFKDAISNSTDDKFIRDAIESCMCIHSNIPKDSIIKSIIKNFKTMLSNDSFKRNKKSWAHLTNNINGFYLVQYIDHSDFE